ncbi:uncharacterized protein SPSK_10070 [Sporothrix schenckii 1099-18]|uniref:Uncharacterized protein n=1 Tax=Sporothrix schenckii 1099-18 TaxID=1397361 RepID=A0A0F2M8U3_SPOSC|nr:uncharacterized protein SPSK_10070 [Sporothrix schenckii 1099-18]KJR86052.1 hypothetical protein SPSK_10070 [Sporothrix schenckii 1099-18]
MQYFNLLTTGAGLFGTGVLAAPSPAVDSIFRPGECFSAETTARLCYTAPKNTPQDVSVDDIKFAATYLRSYGRQKNALVLLEK